jgi:hypothetical protein
MPVPQVLSAGEQLVGRLGLVRKPLLKAPVPAPWFEAGALSWLNQSLQAEVAAKGKRGGIGC